MKVLLVRLSSMGDLIHTLPAVHDLAQNRPDIELHWLSESGFSDIARLHPFVKKVHEMSWRKWRKQLTRSETLNALGRLKDSLQQEQFDLVLDSQGLLKSALFAKMAAAPVWGLDKHSARERWVSCFYQKKFAVEKGRSAVWRNRALFAQVFQYNLPEGLEFGLRVPEAGRLQYLQQPYYVGLHATSRDSKLWPVGNWIALFEKLYQESNGAVYLPWGNETEKLRAEHIAQQLPFVQVCEQMNLLQASYLLDNARAIIGVDTGLLHLANALNKPVVGIYTDTDPIKTGVQESLWAKNLGNVKQIPCVEDVYQAVQSCITAYDKNGKKC